MTTVTTVTTPTAGQIRNVFMDRKMELTGWWENYLKTVLGGEPYPLNGNVQGKYYLHDALALMEPTAKRELWNENLNFMIGSSLLLTERGTADEMQRVYDKFIKREETKESALEPMNVARDMVNIDAQTIADFKKCEETEWKDSTGKLIDSKQERVVWPDRLPGKPFIIRPHHLGPICYPGLWRQAVNVVKGSTAAIWNQRLSAMADKANAPTGPVLNFVRDWGPTILGENEYQAAASSAHSGHFNHLSTFNNHYEPYPHRYQVDDYDRYMPMYEHVHPFVQPQLSTSNGNDSMQYGLMIIGLALFIFLMLCVTFTVLSGVCFAIGRVSNARKSDKIPYEVIEELTV
eukprot:470664_1